MHMSKTTTHCFFMDISPVPCSDGHHLSVVVNVVGVVANVVGVLFPSPAPPAGPLQAPL